MIKNLSLFFFIAILSPYSFSAEKTLRVNDYSAPNTAYASKMLTLAIAHSDNPDYKVEAINNA